MAGSNMPLMLLEASACNLTRTANVPLNMAYSLELKLKTYYEFSKCMSIAYASVDLSSKKVLPHVPHVQIIEIIQYRSYRSK